VTEFNVEKFGNPEKFPLVFLHGFMGSADDWAEISQSLVDDYYCFAFDLPGHGKTKVISNDDYLIENCASKIIEWTDNNINGKFNLCGYSMGGRLALYIAVNYPDKINRVIVESASPGLKTEEEKQKRIQVDSLRAKRLLMEPLDQFLDDWYELPLFGTINKKSDEYKNMIIRRLKNNPKSLAKSLIYMGIGNQPSLWNHLDKIKSRLLLLVGEKDNKFKIIADEIARQCVKAQIKIVQDAGHTVHMNNKIKYIDTLRRFLKE